MAEILDHELDDGIPQIAYFVCRRIKHVHVLHAQKIARANCGSPIVFHAEAVREGRSILLCWLRFRCGCLSFAWPFPRLWSSSVTNSTDFLLLFGSGCIALATFLAFLTQLFLVQISLELFIGKTTAETSGGNCQGRCNFYWPATRYHMPWAFRQRIAIRKRKLTTTRSTLMRHILSYRGQLRSSNAGLRSLGRTLRLDGET